MTERLFDVQDVGAEETRASAVSEAAGPGERRDPKTGGSKTADSAPTNVEEVVEPQPQDGGLPSNPGSWTGDAPADSRGTEPVGGNRGDGGAAVPPTSTYFAGSTEMGYEGPKTLSYSQVSTYSKCGERYRLSYLDPEARALQVVHGSGLGGSAIHRAAEIGESLEWWRMGPEGLELYRQAFLVDFGLRIAEAFATCPTCEGQGRSGEVPCPVCGGRGRLYGEAAVTWGGRKHILVDDDGQDVTERYWDPEWNHGDGGWRTRKVKIGEDLLWWANMGSRLFLKRHMAIRREDEASGVRVVIDEDGGLPWVERLMRTRLEGVDRLISGMVDIYLFANQDGEGIIRDLKTGTWIDPFQLAIYAWLIGEVTEGAQTPTWGEIEYLRGTKPETWLQRYDLRPWIPLVPRVIRDADAGIKAGYFPLQMSKDCSWCFVREFCAFGKTLAQDD